MQLGYFVLNPYFLCFVIAQTAEVHGVQVYKLTPAAIWMVSGLQNWKKNSKKLNKTQL